jgi:integrase
MPRKRAAPRLWLDRGRGQWVIRDGTSFIRTGCAESERSSAEKRLAEYLGQKHQPGRGPDPLIADVLLVYNQEHVPHISKRGQRNTSYNIANLAEWWGARNVGAITSRACREYAASRANGGARRDLEVLRAAVRYWQREHGPLATVPTIVLPPTGEPRDRWLTRSEAARLLWAARRTEHLRRFILLAIYTGSRSKNIFGLRWEQVDLKGGVMHRRGQGERENARKRTPPVRLGRRIVSHLSRWQRMDAALGAPGANSMWVCAYDGNAIKEIRRSLRNAVKRAGLKNVTPHVFRHTRATWLMQNGVDPWQAAGHLGMTLKTLERVYGHHHPDHQKEAAEV